MREEIWTSDKWRELFGFERSDRLDVDSMIQRLHPEDREAVRQTLAKALSGEGGYETEYRVMLPDGRMRWIASRGGVEFDAAGKPVIMRGASLDLTTRNQAEEVAHNLSGRLIQAQEEDQMRDVKKIALNTVVQSLKVRSGMENGPVGQVVARFLAGDICIRCYNPKQTFIKSSLKAH